jgi:5'-3' exonuclease
MNTIACVDGSYAIYHTLYSAVNKWKAESPYSDCIDDVPSPEDDFEPVDLTEYPDFVDTLKGKLIDMIFRVRKMLDSFNTTMMSNTFGDIFFVLDPEHGHKSRSWRYKIYPEYKGQRKDALEKKAFDVYKIFAKSIEILRERGEFEKKYGLRIVSVDNAEADDIIATIFMDENNVDFNKFLIANDKDYLQIAGVTQMTLEDKQVMIEQAYPELLTVTPDLYLIAKIVSGDVSDNISHVFPKVGYKTAVKKYVMNLDYLNESLERDVVAMEKFKRNTKLIDFGCIPKKIRASIKNTLALG